MQKGVYILFVLMLGWAGYAQPALNKKYTLGSKSSAAVNIYPTDTCYYIVGSYQNPGGLLHIDPFFIKLDFDGNVLIHKTFHLDTTEVGPNTTTNLIETYDNKLLVQYSFDEIVGLVKYDLNGDTLWTRKLTEVYYIDSMRGGKPGKIYENPADSSITGIALFHEDITFRDSIGLFNISKDGDLNFIKKYEDVGTAYEYFFLFDLLKIDDGYLIGSGLHHFDSFEDVRYRTHIIKTDFLGNVIARKTYDDNLYEYGCNGLIQAEDGGYFYGSLNGFWNETYGAVDYHNYLVKLDEDLNKEWAKTFGQNTDPNYGQISRILTTSDGNYIMMGHITHNNLVSGFLIKFNLEGEFIWDSYFSLAPKVDGYSEPLHKLYDFALTPDNGYILTGSLIDYYTLSLDDTSYQSWVVKVDSFGCLVPGCQDVLSTESEADNFSMKLYPNPTTDFINVYYNTQAFSESTTLELYNLQGQHVQSWQVTQNNMTSILDVSHLSTGTYVLNLVGDGELLKSEKVVVE